MDIFLEEVDRFVNAAMTSGHITSEADVKKLSDYPQKLKSMVQHLHIPKTIDVAQRNRLLKEMEEMLQSDLPIVNELNNMKIPDVMDALKRFEE